jgi:DNA mismatch endonuclease (patch repair protein)
MSLIRAKNTKPELITRRALHALGYRFRVHVSALPGRPDIVLPKRRTIIQVKGCFWHGHRCLQGRMPHGNREYWSAKIAGNRKRDNRNERALRRLGWRVHAIWECEIRRSTLHRLGSRLARLIERK